MSGDAEAVRERGVDVEGFLGGALLVRFRHGRDRAHVVQPVAQLDEQDPRVLGHGDQHLAHGCGLRCLARVERDPLQLGDAVDDLGHGGAEARFELGQRHCRVLDRIMEQGGCKRYVVHPEAGKDGGHGDGMGNVGLTGTADLAFVGALGRLVGPQDQARITLGVALPVRRQQRRQCVRTGRALPPPGQDAFHRCSGSAPRGPLDSGHAMSFPFVPQVPHLLVT